MVQITEKISTLPIYVGIDVHKEKWVISIYRGDQHLKSFSMSACMDSLIKHLKKNYPDAKISCVYEAGFSGFWLQKGLEKAGISCEVANACDIPTTDYERRRKTDKLDSQKLGRQLSMGNIPSVYIPSDTQLQIRSLVRARMTIAKEKRKAMNRIRAFINFQGIVMPKAINNKLWSRKGQSWIKQEVTKYMGLNHHLELYELLRRQELKAGCEIRQYFRQSEEYKELFECLTSIPGIGWISASLLISELGRMDRFSNLDQLASFCGLVPDVRSSADRHQVLGISKRANKRLRTVLVESAWVNIRYDEAMGRVFAKAVSEGKPKQKSIIKVARKLLNRMRAVWVKKEKYQCNKT